MLFGDGFEWAEFVNARVIDENIRRGGRRLFDGFGDEPGQWRPFRHVALHGDGFAAVRGDGADDLVRAGFAGCVIDDDRRAFGGEGLCDGCADAFGRAGDDGDFTF